MLKNNKQKAAKVEKQLSDARAKLRSTRPENYPNEGHFRKVLLSRSKKVLALQYLLSVLKKQANTDRQQRFLDYEDRRFERHCTRGNFSLSSDYSRNYKDYRKRFTPLQRARYEEILRGRAGAWIEAEAVDVVMREPAPGVCCEKCLVTQLKLSSVSESL
jgi:hypothetical protein